MRSDELYQHTAERVRRVDDKTVFVAAEIENHAIVADKINSGAELAFDVIRVAPPCVGDKSEPGADRPFSLRMTLPELPERAASNHLHGTSLPCHHFGEKHCLDFSTAAPGNDRL